MEVTALRTFMHAQETVRKGQRIKVTAAEARDYAASGFVDAPQTEDTAEPDEDKTAGKSRGKRDASREA